MPFVGKPYRIHYIAKNFTSGLTDVRMVVYKPNGVKQGVYTLQELNTGDGRGIYYYDYEDSDIEGTYLFVVNSISVPKKDARQVYFEILRHWDDIEKAQIRDALGVNGDKIVAQNGQLQIIQQSITNTTSTLTTIQSTISLLQQDIEFIKQIEGGRWKIDKITNQMIFYKDDNITEIARFNLYNDLQQPASENIYERRRI